MKVKAWVELSQEIEVEIDARQIQGAVSEAFSRAQSDQQENPSRADVLIFLNRLGAYLRGIADEQIAEMTEGQRATVATFLREQSERYGVELPGQLVKEAL